MNSLVLKLVVTPTLIGVASLVGRRWGPAVSGWLVGLPLTSGPITFFLAISHGTAFAAAAAASIIAGALSFIAFTLTYAWLAMRAPWPPTLAASTLAFATATALLQQLVLPLVPQFVVVLGALALSLRLLPSHAGAPLPASGSPPRWDLPARMVVATAFVLALTAAASALGPRLTGLLAPFPVYAATLTIFAQRAQGAVGATSVLRGVILGVFAFASFFFVLAATIDRIGIAPSFAAATAVALAVQAATLWVVRRTAITSPAH